MEDDFSPTRYEKAVTKLMPKYGMRIYENRLRMAAAGGYVAGSRTRRSLKSWRAGNKDANSDINPDLQTIRGRCRDAERNIPMATGIANTKAIEVVGNGLIHHSRIDRNILNLTEEQAEAKQNEIDREWDLFYNDYEVDAARTLNGNAFTQNMYRQKNSNGAGLMVFPRIKREGNPYSLKLQMIEVDRLTNKGYAQDSDKLSMGIVLGDHGDPTAYQILDQHPGSVLNRKGHTWTEVPAFGKNTGLKNVIHYYQPTRPGQAHGVPDFAPILELLKTLGAYTTNEAVAAEVASLFTVFIESPTGTTGFDPVTNMGAETGATSSDNDTKLGNGAIVYTKPDEKISTANPGRPNTAFNGFVLAISRQIGAAVNLPYEILIKHFTASYSAARAALLTAWKYFLVERQHLADNYCQQVKNVWMYEAVSIGRISAPGFFTDPLIRKAYSKSLWTGPAKGMIDEKKEIEAAIMRMDNNLSTGQRETIEINNTDFYDNIEQRGREKKRELGAGAVPVSKDGNQPKEEEVPKPGSDLENGDLEE